MTAGVDAAVFIRRRPEEPTRALLAQAVERWAPGRFFGVARTEAGQPLLPGSGLHCSVSHSGDIWLCALSEQPVGIDVQLHRARRPAAVARRYFHPAEAAFVERGQGRDFFHVWAAKESYVKFTGRGLSQGLASFCVVDGAGLSGAALGVELLSVPLAGGCSLCLCARRMRAVGLYRL